MTDLKDDEPVVVDEGDDPEVEETLFCCLCSLSFF